MPGDSDLKRKKKERTFDQERFLSKLKNEKLKFFDVLSFLEGTAKKNRSPSEV